MSYYFSDYGELSYPFILFGFFPELIFKQLGETECLPCIYDKSKADANARLKKTQIL